MCIKFQWAPGFRFALSKTKLCRYDPLYTIFLLLGVLGTFKAYPTLSDPGLFLSTLSIFPEIYPCDYASKDRRIFIDSFSRSSASHGDCSYSPSRNTPHAPFQSPLAQHWHRKCKFLLCFDTGVCMRKRSWAHWRCLGRFTYCHWERNRRLCSRTGMRGHIEVMLALNNHVFEKSRRM